MAYKLIAIDLDDTLLADTLTIPPRVKHAVQKASDSGIYVVLCTGRIKKGAQRFYDELGLDTLMITTGGALIYDTAGKIVYTNCVDPDLTRQLLEYAADHRLHAQVYLDGELVYPKSNEYSRQYETVNGIAGIEKPDLLDMEMIITPKVLFITEPEEIGALHTSMRTLFPMLNVKRSKPTFLEFSSPDASKGEALAFVADYYGIARSEVIAIGDSEIDQSMIEYAGLGVAVDNATPAVRDAADYICPSNNDGGVADVIEKFVLEAQNNEGKAKA